MQLSNREKLLLVSLAIVLTIGGFFYFVAKPQFAKIDELRKSKLEYQAKVKELNTQLAVTNPIYAESKLLEQKTKDRTAAYFPNISQEKIITILDGQFNISSFQPSSINFTDMNDIVSTKDKATINNDGKNLLDDLEMSFKKIEPIVNNSTESSAADQRIQDATSNSIDRLSVTLAYKASYEEISALIRTFEVYKRRIVLDKITCTRGDNNELSGTIELSFYAIPKLFDEDLDYTTWTYNNVYGKYNPFLPFGGYLDPAVVSGVPLTTSQKSDFFMSLKPISSDIPTVMIGKKGESESKTYLYADNPAFENVEIRFTKKGTQYYYGYKTKSGSYPTNYASLINFIPKSNDITIEILSSKRQGDTDLSGANIKIINETDLTVKANVLFDDKVNHRAKFVNNTGKATVTSTMEE